MDQTNSDFDYTFPIDYKHNISLVWFAKNQRWISCREEIHLNLKFLEISYCCDGMPNLNSDMNFLFIKNNLCCPRDIRFLAYWGPIEGFS